MREAKLILPQASTDQEADLITDFELDLLDAFGGFTSIKCNGAWKDGDGIVHVDTNFQYVVAIAEEEEGKLRSMAIGAAAKLDQQCLYFVGTSGEVELVTLDGTNAPMMEDAK